MKIKFFPLLLLSVFFTNCKEKPSANIEDSKPKIIEVKYGKPFFDFDEVDYYFTEITEEYAMNFNGKAKF